MKFLFIISVFDKNYLTELDMKKDEVYTWEQREKDDKYIMERMHPAVLIPGMFIALMVIVGCIFKGIMAW